ncbi:Rrf2 family transcriptional regulator [Natrarchaeobaculum aegyptiacum]|uniref:TrmB family transcriptional regulator n=1 Tax=Natrarchaeobaculum aegyptiacum TaxID=745377 RepID=A0A2Z2HUE9_9EURY|nr:Rrf2 family transcriptional regulator [Natrarchaeobaculum aegyptiacum]ARS90869.1 TrmB family transcriptional regulator [Natrarchaeobaculum aegyptiacum]
MGRIELTNSQRRILTVLVNRYQAEDSPIPAKEISSEVDREPRTVRNQMSSLKDLGLVEGIPGPSGGYQPTSAGFDILDRETVENPEMAVLAREFDRVDAIVDEISFPNVHNPDTCRARIRFQQSIQEFDEGDAIAIGAMPNSELLLAGKIEAIETTRNQIILDVARVEA